MLVKHVKIFMKMNVWCMFNMFCVDFEVVRFGGGGGVGFCSETTSQFFLNYNMTHLNNKCLLIDLLILYMYMCLLKEFRAVYQSITY